MTEKTRRGPLAFVLLLCFLATPAWCVTKAPTALLPAVASAQKAAEGPEVFEVTEVIPRSERTLARLREIRGKLDVDTSEDRIDRELPALSQEMEARWKAEAPTLRDGRSIRRLNDLLYEWGARSAQIDAWKALLVSSSRDWIAEEQALERGAASWEATRSALKDDAPPAVRERLAEVLREIEATRVLFRDKTARLVATQSRLAEQHQELNNIRGEFEALRKRSGQGLFSRDSPPLWTALADELPAQSIAAQTSETIAKVLAELTRLFEFMRTGMIEHVLAFLLLFAFFRYLRRLAAETAGIKPTASEQLVLDRSFFSALLLALGLVPILYFDASPQLLRLLILPGLIPILALTPAILPPRMRLGFYLFTVILLLDVLRNFLPTHWVLARILLLSVSVLGALGLAAALRLLRQESAPGARPHGLLHALLLVGLVLCVASIVANVAGNQSLAEYLVSPPVRLLFIGVTIRLGVVVATTCIVMALRTPAALLSHIVQERGAAVAANSRRFAVLAGIGLWIYLALFNFGLLAAAWDVAGQALDQEWQVGAAAISMRSIVTFFAVLFAGYILSRMLRSILADEIFPRFHFPRGVPDALTLLARYGVLLVGFLLALSSAGVDLSKVTLAISALGVGIGFGLQNIVNNFVSGLILVFEHPIQVGDYIEIGPHYGQVKRIGFRSSQVLTQDGSEVIIPNAELIGTKVINWSLCDAVRRIGIPVPVAIGTDARRVVDLLQSIARDCPQVLANPPPSAVLEAFDDDSMRFQLRCWVRTEQMPAARNALLLALDKALRDAGIENPKGELNLHFPGPQPIRFAAADSSA